jgi:ACR3 family arsenite efflux pump ArsB
VTAAHRSGVGTDALPDPSRRLSTSDRLQPLLLIGAIGVGLALARVAPGVAGSLLPLVTVGVGFLIYLIMLGLDLDQLRWGTSERRFVVTAVVINFAIAPVLAWGLGLIMLSDHPELRVGLLLFLITPCIGWYLVFIDLAGGDNLLGVSLLGINLVLQVLLLPLYLQIFADKAVAADLDVLVRSVTIYLVVPAALAIVTRVALRHHRRRAGPHRRADVSVSRRLRMLTPSLGTAKTTTLFVVIVSMFASQSDALTNDPATLLRVVPPIVAFFALSFVLALTIARAQHMSFDRAVVLVFTTASRNSEVSLAIAVTAFTSPLVAAVVAIGPAIELPLLMLMVRALTALENSWPRGVRTRLPKNARSPRRRSMAPDNAIR